MLAKKRQCVAFLMLLFLSSCLHQGSKEKGYVRDIVLGALPIDSLFASSLDLDIPGLLDVFYLENVFLLRTRDPKNLFYTLDKNSYHIITAFGTRGEGPTDFLYPRNFTRAGGDSLWIADMGLKRVYHTVISGEGQSPAMLESIDFKDIHSEASYMLNKHIMFGVANSIRDSTVFFLQNVAPGGTVDTFRYWTCGLPKKYDDLSEAQKLTYSQNNTAIKPDRTKMVLVSYFSPYISVISTDGRLEQIISMKDLDTNEGLTHTNFEKKLNTIFEGVAVTDNYIYVVYNNQLNEEVAALSKPIEILVFDWKLNPVRRLYVSEYILRIGISSDDKELIGLDYTNERIFKYQLF